MTRQQAAPRHTNRLISETSPYLLQHAHNPVDWCVSGGPSRSGVARPTARAESSLVHDQILRDRCQDSGNLGRIERLVEAVLNDRVGSEKLRREEIIVVSKIGYVQREA